MRPEFEILLVCVNDAHMNPRMRYLKMNGCGNDFVIVDARAQGNLMLSPTRARAIADRQSGVGCDQIIALERSLQGQAFMRIWNADGGQSEACGNAARCVAWMLMEESGADMARIESAAGVLDAERKGPTTITVDMGAPLLHWDEIPLARPMETDEMHFAAGGYEAPGAVNMGNPHVVFFVADVGSVPIETLGPKVERDPMFPEGVNVGFAEVRARTLIRLRVWERGTGLTKACGTGACAAVVAGVRQDRLDRAVSVLVDGGELFIEWRESDERVLMTGPVELEGEGELAIEECVRSLSRRVR